MSSKQNCNIFRMLWGCVIPVSILAITGGLLYYYLENGGNTDALQNNTLYNKTQGLLDQFPDLGLFHAEDPFGDLNGTYAWPNDGTGLELTLVNCLDSRWNSFFDQAVSDWDNGTPDALTLSTANGTVDSTCDPVDGVMKVCDGDYGQTDWKGINKILLDDYGRIYASAARMNEYFLPADSDPNERQYTMCHEIGHGFGLKHTDEAFYNLNQGNCLDYTTRPKSNMHPDERLWNVLAQVYGTVDGSMRGTTVGSGVYNTGSGLSNKTVNNNGGGSGRRRHYRSLVSSKDIPDDIKKASTQIDEYFTAEAYRQNNRRRRRRMKARSLSTPDYHHRILQQNHFVEAHEFHIVESGHKIRVHLLLA